MDISVSAIEGNRQCLDGGAMFGNAPRALWSRWLKPDHIGRIELACRCLLIVMGDTKILCETGIGAFFAPKLAERFGVQSPQQHVLLDNLTMRKIAPEQIDWVILSHLHFDHAGGLLAPYDANNSNSDALPELAFPKAKFVVGREAWQRATHPHARDRASFIPGLTAALEASGRLLLVDGHTIPGLPEKHFRVRYSHGHTPGQMHLCLIGARETLFFCGDLVPGSQWMHIPITMGYDRFPEQVIDEKISLYDEALSQGWQLFFTHDPIYALGKGKKVGEKVVTDQLRTDLSDYLL